MSRRLPESSLVIGRETDEQFKGQALSWELKDGVIELALHREPCNEIGSLTLEELEKFAAALAGLRTPKPTR